MGVMIRQAGGLRATGWRGKNSSNDGNGGGTLQRKKDGREEKSAKRRLSASAVYEILKSVPEGKVTTYGDLAAAAGFPGASRAVGKIMNKNPDLVVVPCHRVVMSDGRIGGFALGRAMKKELLEKEGVSFDLNKSNDERDDRIHDFASHRAVLTHPSHGRHDRHGKSLATAAASKTMIKRKKRKEK